VSKEQASHSLVFSVRHYICFVVQTNSDCLRNLLVRHCEQILFSIQIYLSLTGYHTKQTIHKYTRSQFVSLYRTSTVEVTWSVSSRHRPIAWHGGRTSCPVSAIPSAKWLPTYVCVFQWAGAVFLHLPHCWVRRSLKTWLNSSMTSLDLQRLVYGVKHTTNNTTTAGKLQKELKSTIKFYNIRLVHYISGFLKPYDSFVWETDLKLKLFATCSIIVKRILSFMN